MLTKSIPSEYLVRKTTLSLPELEWAFENGVIGAQNVVDVATAMLEAGFESEDVVQLAGLTHQELPEVKGLLGGYLGDADVKQIQEKWLWLVLSWIYEQERKKPDIFDTLDNLYADFGYPEEMTSFGPYAPAYQGKRDSAEVRDEVMREWQRYLERGEARFAGRKASRMTAAVEQ